MPYFIYKMFPDKKLGLVKSFNEYREAKQVATSLRTAKGPNDDYVVKIMFAADPAEAEHLLTMKRERQPSDDD